MGTILCATDLGPHGRKALGHAVALARATGDELLLVHVCDAAPVVPRDPVPDEILPAMRALEHHLDVRRQEAQARLEVERAQVEGQGVRCRAELLDGRPADAIVAAAERHQASLLVVGPHGGPGAEASLAARVRDRVLGTTAARVAREAPCPVLVSDEATDEATHSTDASAGLTGRWMVATDFSAPAREAVRCARDLAAAVGAELVVVHVVQPVPGLHEDAPSEEVRSWSSLLREHGARRAAKDLAEWVQAEVPNARVAERLGFGDAAEELSAAAQELGASVLVVGTHGRSTLGRALLGSTAERCLRHAKGPVLVVRTIPDANT